MDVGVAQVAAGLEDAVLAGDDAADFLSSRVQRPVPVTGVLRDYHKATGDKRVIPALLEYARYMERRLPEQPLSERAKARAPDQIDTLFWISIEPARSSCSEWRTISTRRQNGGARFTVSSMNRRVICARSTASMSRKR